MTKKIKLEDVINAAKPLAVCTRGWDGMGYGYGYNCLDREVDIANPDHETTDWWPYDKSCDNCELARAIGVVSKGTMTHKQLTEKIRKDERRRRYEDLKREFG